MKRVPLDGQFGKLRVGHLETSLVGILVQLGTDAEPCFGGRAADQIDHDLAADQGTSAPVVGDVAEHPMFDLVPLAGSGGKVTDLDREAEVIGQLLHLAFPQADPIAVAAATIRRDQQAAGMRIAGMAHFFPPAPDAFNREFGGVVIDPNADPPLIGCDIVDAIGRDLAEVRIKEIIDANVLGLSLGLPFLAAVLESADQFLLPGVDRNHRIASRLVLRRPVSDMVELGVPVRMLAAFPGLAGRLQTVAKVRQKVPDTPPADLMALRGQFLGKPRRALARPAQRRLRVTAGGRLNQGIKVAQKRRILVGQFLAPAPFGTDATLAGGTGSRGRGRGLRRRRSQFFQTGMDRRARQADGLRHGAHATSSQGAGLNSSPQTQRGFVQPSRQSPILVLDRPYITHTRKVGDHPECSSYFCRGPKAQPAFRFYSLWDKICRSDVLHEAYRRCRQNAGAPGCDGETFEAIEARGLDLWLEELQRELRTGTYRPQPLLRVWIAKSSGNGQRPLGIPALRDRVTQAATLLILGPIFETDLLPNQYGFRSGLDAKMAIRRACWHIRDHGRHDVADVDLSDYFSSIPHGPLMR